MNTNRVRQRFFIILAITVIWLGVFPAAVNAWGTKGHQIIARIAADQLSSQARRNVAKLLNGASLESVATWADLKGAAHSLPHMVSIPYGANRFDPTANCKEDCLIRAINHYHSVLGNTKKTTTERAEALKFLIHYIGDLHQPFHCAAGDDYGRRISLKFSGKSTNLHQLWDTDMIDKEGRLTADQYVKKRLATRSVSQSAYNLSRGTIVDWALESNKLATSAHLPGPLVPDQWPNKIGVVDDQLYKAGVRLASILNDIFR